MNEKEKPLLEEAQINESDFTEMLQKNLRDLNALLEIAAGLKLNLYLLVSNNVAEFQITKTIHG